MENKWKIVSMSTEFASPFMRLIAEHCMHEEKETEHTFYRLEFSDWVNIVPVTTEGDVVMVRQHRFGVGKDTLEVPGGTMDVGETEPLLAVRRELMEETGYDSDSIIYLGNALVNPAIQNNRCHFFLALNAVKRGEQELDATEDISLEIYPLSQVITLITSGAIQHSLALQGLVLSLLALGETAAWPRLER